MLFAFGRLVFFAISAALIGVAAVFSLHVLGKKQTYPALRHPLAAETPLNVIWVGEAEAAPADVPSAGVIKKQFESSPVSLMGITVRKTADQQWVVYNHQNLDELTNQTGFVGQYTLDELRNMRFRSNNEPLLSLEEALSLLPIARWYITVYQPARGPAIESLKQTIVNVGAEERVIVTSPFQETTGELRKINYKWLTGNSTAELAKAQFMTALFLETALDIEADVIAVQKLNSRLIQELLRRNKIVIIQDPSPVARQQLQNLSTKIGILTTRPGY